jgi:hypothetical protein
MINDYSKINVGDNILDSKINDIYQRSEKFIIYRNIENHIAYDSNDDTILDKIKNALSKYYIYKASNGDDFDLNEICNLNVIRIAINSKTEDVIKYLEEYEKNYQTKKSTTIKFHYLLRTLIMTIVFSVLCAMVNIFSAEFNNDMLYKIKDITLYITFGLYGGFISTYQNLHKIDTLKIQNKKNCSINGISRMFLSAILGLIAAFIIKSGIALSFIKDINTYGILVFCVLGGFSEKLIPNILIKISENKKNA